MPDSDDDRGRDEQLTGDDQATVDTAPQPQDHDTGGYDDDATVTIDQASEPDDDDPSNRDADNDGDDDGQD